MRQSAKSASAPGVQLLFYRAALPLSRQTLTYVARGHPPPPCRDRLVLVQGAPRRAGPAGTGLPAERRPYADTAAGFGVSTATAWRYVNETVALLAARAPKLRRALRDARETGQAYVVIDGTFIPIDRVAADRPFYSGKHRRTG